MSEAVMKRIMSRKFGFAVTVQIIATGALLIGAAAFDEWSTFTQWNAGMYFGGNALEHAADAYKSRYEQ